MPNAVFGLKVAFRKQPESLECMHDADESFLYLSIAKASS